MHEAERTGPPAGLTPAQRLAFDVAERLGMTVAEVCDRMTTQELLTWARLHTIDDEHRRMNSLRRLVEVHRGSSR